MGGGRQKTRLSQVRSSRHPTTNRFDKLTMPTSNDVRQNQAIRGHRHPGGRWRRRPRAARSTSPARNASSLRFRSLCLDLQPSGRRHRPRRTSWLLDRIWASSSETWASPPRRTQRSPSRRNRLLTCRSPWWTRLPASSFECCLKYKLKFTDLRLCHPLSPETFLKTRNYFPFKTNKQAREKIS